MKTGFVPRCGLALLALLPLASFAADQVVDLDPEGGVATYLLAHNGGGQLTQGTNSVTYTSSGGVNGNGFYLNFPTVSLAEVGSKVVLSLILEIPAGANSANGVRMLLGSDNGGTRVTTDVAVDGFPAQYSGLGMSIQINTSDLLTGAGSALFKELTNAANPTLLGGLKAKPASSENTVDIGGLPKKLELVIERIAPAVDDDLTVDVRTSLTITPDASLGRPAVESWTQEFNSISASDYDDFNLFRLGLWNNLATGTPTIIVRDISLTVSAAPSGFGPFPIDDQQGVQTGPNFLGYLYVPFRPWVYNFSLNSWLYISADMISTAGSFAYFFDFGNRTALGGDWYYSWDLGTYLYSFDGPASGGWGWVINLSPL